MNQNSKTKNSTFNFFSSVVLQFISIIGAFLVRRAFIKTLGVEYLGIAGLFNNILAVLSLAEMGVGTAMSYSLYKAIADSDKEKIAGLTNFYKSIYHKVALAVLIIGIGFIPFLHMIVNLE